MSVIENNNFINNTLSAKVKLSQQTKSNDYDNIKLHTTRRVISSNYALKPMPLRHTKHLLPWLMSLVVSAVKQSTNPMTF